MVRKAYCCRRSCRQAGNRAHDQCGCGAINPEAEVAATRAVHSCVRDCDQARCLVSVTYQSIAKARRQTYAVLRPLPHARVPWPRPYPLFCFLGGLGTRALPRPFHFGGNTDFVPKEGIFLYLFLTHFSRGWAIFREISSLTNLL